VRPKKKWGQNFLRNRGAVEKIVAAIEPARDDVIVEIGPGEGVLTDHLATLGNQVMAIEIDPDLAQRLRTRLPNIADPNLRRAVFMLQKEVAQRLTAKPRDEQYGFLTLYAQIFTASRILLTLGPKSFHPPPKVDSAVVVLDPHAPPPGHDRLIDLVSAAFRMRRKKLVNNLTEWPREIVIQALRDAHLDEGVRAEEMTLDDFRRLAQRLTR
jgi:16S rRNA (adenine1518-N6/adenine1519-N6)-dimethyltransferase